MDIVGLGRKLEGEVGLLGAAPVKSIQKDRRSHELPAGGRPASSSKFGVFIWRAQQRSTISINWSWFRSKRLEQEK